MVLPLRQDVSCQRIKGGFLLFDPRNGRCFSVDGSGARMLRGILAHRDVESIAKDIASFYGIPDAVALNDVLAFFGAMRKKGLLARQAAD